jgi:hypothetical protein
MKRHLIAAALAIASAAFGSSAWAQSAPPPATCNSFVGFFLTDCQLRWNGFQVYGTIDVGGTYQTHGDGALDLNHPVGASYLLGNSATNAVGRVAGFGLGPNALSQSVVGVRWLEPVGGGWSVIGQAELAFDPYSALLANAPQAMFNSIHVPENQQLVPYDSSRWGWLAGQIYAGVSNPVWGTLTAGRINAPLTDAVIAYDPMGGSYAFSLIGNSGLTCGAGDTETCRWTTGLKYRVNLGAFRFVVAGQPIGGSNSGYNAYNPNNGAIEGGVGADTRMIGPGVLSMDFLGAYERDAVNWSTLFPGQTFFGTSGTPLTYPAGGLKATISDNTSGMVVAKYSFGSWGAAAPAPVVTKEGPMYTKAPPVQTGIPLTLYAGYEYIQFANPSDPQTTSFRDDGFLFNATNAGATTLSANGTTIANNAFNSLCASGPTNGCSDRVMQSMWTGAKYGITRDLDIIGAYYHYIQNTFVHGVNCSIAVAAANSRCQGWFDDWSVVLDWRFLPKWDAYIGTMYSAAYGGLANGDISRNNLAITAGVRFRF